MTEITQGTLFGGRIRHDQPRQGFRSGIEPVLLAASLPAQPGEVVLEGGTGSGAALLCLAARVPGVGGVGVEIDPSQAALAAANMAANGFTGVRVVQDDLTTMRLEGRFDHAMANPPYHAAGGTESPDIARERAKRGDPDLLDVWAMALARTLRHRGTLTFILPAWQIPACLVALAAAGAPAAAIMPLWPRAGVPAKLTIIRGIKGGRSPLSVLPGLALHGPDGRFTDQTDAILRLGEALPLTDR